MPKFDFQQDEIVQSRCFLLQLPAELRLQILRHLLCAKYDILYDDINSSLKDPVRDPMCLCPAPLWSHDLAKPLPFRSGYGPDMLPLAAKPQLQSQILRCCQTLYKQGHCLLYLENRLQVIADGTRVQHVKVVGRMLGLNYLTLDPVTDMLFAPPAAAAAFLDFSTRFARIGVRMMIRPETDESKIKQLFLCLCVAMRKILEGKDVVIYVVPASSPQTFSIPRDSLTPFKYLRCNRIIFHGFANLVTEDLTQLIEGIQPVHDLWASRKQLDRLVCHISACTGRDVYTENFRELIQLSDALLDCDFAAFSKQRDLFINICEFTFQQYIQLMLNSLTDQELVFKKLKAVTRTG